MSNQYNDLIVDKIIDETDKIKFLREEDSIEYMRKWYQAVMDNDGLIDIEKVRPPLFSVETMTDDQLKNQEDKFINSFSE